LLRIETRQLCRSVDVMTNLTVTYRNVSDDDRDAYDRQWSALRDAARAGGMRAWRFRSAEAGDEYIEFFEEAERDAAEGLRASAIRTALDAAFPPLSARGWCEAPVEAPGRDGVDDRTELLALFRERSLRRGEFVLSSGAKSDYYIDARPATMSAAGQRLIGRLGIAALDARGWQADAVGGLTLGADPVAYAIAHASARHGRNVDAFTVRKHAKAHGTGRRVEGNLADGAAVVVIEDVLTTGGSALDAIRAVEAEGASVLGVLALVDREAGGSDRLAKEGYAVAALFTVSELLDDRV
jgi:orotate phosphoribosyltransferase